MSECDTYNGIARIIYINISTTTRKITQHYCANGSIIINLLLLSIRKGQNLGKILNVHIKSLSFTFLLSMPYQSGVGLIDDWIKRKP